MNNTFCFISNTGDSRYDKLLECAVNSFKKWHPEIPVYVNTEPYDPNLPIGINRYGRVIEIALKYQFNKVIILGADTITCSRLDEFFIYNEDILCTLDHPVPLFYPSLDFSNSYSFFVDLHKHVNADVVCFNNLQSLQYVIDIGIRYKQEIERISTTNNLQSTSFVHDRIHYAEQGALNMLIHGHPMMQIEKLGVTHRIVDGPYEKSSVIYNARAKGNVGLTPGDEERHCYRPYTNKMYTKDNKLFSFDHKQIKVWHYCDGFGAINSVKDFDTRIKTWVTELFNKNAKQFFIDHCECKSFFEYFDV